VFTVWKVFSFFRRKAKPVKLEVVQRDPFRLTIEEWRAQPDLVKMAADRLRDPYVRLMLDALHNSHLRRYTATGTMEQKAFHLCRCEGYLTALKDFEAMAIASAVEEPVESTFERPDDK